MSTWSWRTCLPQRNGSKLLGNTRRLIQSASKVVQFCHSGWPHKNSQPLTLTLLPTITWEKMGCDLFEWKGAMYLLAVDYCSRYIEIARLTQATSANVINHLKAYLLDTAILRHLSLIMVLSTHQACLKILPRSMSFSMQLVVPTFHRQTEKQNMQYKL